MSPDRARIFDVNDDARTIDLDRRFLRNTGHEIVETASSLKEALGKIPGLSRKRINVALVDGNLSNEFGEGEDGAVLTKAIKEKFPKIKVIGHSSMYEVDGADDNCSTIEGSRALIEKITRI